NVLPGQTAAFDYTVTVTPSAAKDSNFTVSGSITVTNPNAIAATVLTVTDTLTGATCDVDEPANLEVPANGTLAIPYTCTLPDGTASTTGTNAVNITWSTTAL